MSRFTPGPWKAEKDEILKDITPIAYVNVNTEANACLIAQSPMLHEYGYHLAMLVLQSDLYQRVDVKEVVDNFLATHSKVEGK